MKHLILLSLIIGLIFCGCSSDTRSKTASKNNKVNGAAYSKKAVDSLIRVGGISADSLPDGTPSQAEERMRLSKTYDDVKIMDSTFILNNDTLYFYSKYYCLKNINLIEPKLYDLDSKDPQEFLTHPFAIDICLIHNKDTVLNRQFKASDFSPFYKDNFGGNLKKYGSILDPYFPKKNPDKSLIALYCSISIPATDVGIGVDLVIDKNGKYKIEAGD
jgi:hypothetical protein